MFYNDVQKCRLKVCNYGPKVISYKQKEKAQIVMGITSTSS